MKLQFLGAAGTVTGSRTLITAGDRTVLVDCGLFQGYKQLRLRNRQDFPIKPSSIDAVVLTHAHLDHSGWLPALVRQGFKGAVHCTAATADLLGILLPDSGRIHEEDAAYANRKRFSRHDPAVPLYTEADAFEALTHLRPAPWIEPVEVAGLTVSFHPAGHILGASSVRIADGQTSVLFSGDLGRDGDLMMRPPVAPVAADHLVLESTYGDRHHAAEDLLTAMAAVVERTIERGGVVLIPAFAVGRAQGVLRALQLLRDRGDIPAVPIVLDSPMAVNTTDLYRRHAAELRIDPAVLADMTAPVQCVRSLGESKALNRRSGPMVLVSASGMLTGGRVLHHLAQRAGSKENTLLFVGYQAPGTRGGRLLGGEPRIKLHGRQVRIQCEVASIGGFSAHADQTELVDWLARAPAPPRRIWLNHGEPGPADTLRQSIAERLGWAAEVATEDVEWDLSDTEPRVRPAPKPRIPAPAQRPKPTQAHVRADLDTELLARDDMRSVRLMLEHLKVEKGLEEADIHGTVVVFGSTRLGGEDAGQHPRVFARAGYYEEARRFGRIVAEAGEVAGAHVTVITGGGPGIMEGANRGAHEAGALSIGLNITLPHEQAPNRYITPSLSFQFRYFALRKMHFLQRARALVTFPGGYGTLDELFDALCLIQTRKLAPIPVILVGSEFWAQVFDPHWLAAEGLIDAADAELVTVVDTAEQAWSTICAWYAQRGDRAPPLPGEC